MVHSVGNRWLISLIAIGIVIRLVPYLAARSLWYDEALIALNITELSFSRLSGELLYNQAAPIGFLWLEKFLSLLAGNIEYTLRFFPLVAGIICVFLFFRLASLLFSGPFLAVSLAFFIFCPSAVYYSNEVKQYIFDVAATLALSLISLRLLTSGSIDYPLKSLGILGVFLIWFSQPVVFVLVSVAIVLAIHFWQSRNFYAFKWVGMICLCWGVCFLFNYFWFITPALPNRSLQQYHTPYFMPVDFWKWKSLIWYWEQYFNLFRNPLGVIFKYPAGALALTGLYWGIKKNWKATLMFLLPPLFAFIASSFRLYSTIPRLMLFVVPALIYFLTCGVQALDHFLQKLHPKLIYLSFSLAGLLLLQPFLDTAIHQMAKPFKREEIKDCLNFIQQHSVQGDYLYVYAYALPQFDLYQQRYNLKKMQVIRGIAPHENWKKNLVELLKKDRVWLLFSHYKELLDHEKNNKFIQFFKDNKGKELLRYETVGSACYLYSFTAGN